MLTTVGIGSARRIYFLTIDDTAAGFHSSCMVFSYITAVGTAGGLGSAWISNFRTNVDTAGIGSTDKSVVACLGSVGMMNFQSNADMEPPPLYFSAAVGIASAF